MPKRYVRCQDVGLRDAPGQYVDALKINAEYELIGESLGHSGEQMYDLANDERKNGRQRWLKSRFSEPYTKEEDENQENNVNHEEIL